MFGTCGHIHHPLIVPVKHPIAKISRLEVDCWSWTASVSVHISQKNTFTIPSQGHLLRLFFGDVAKSGRFHRSHLEVKTETLKAAL